MNGRGRNGQRATSKDEKAGIECEIGREKEGTSKRGKLEVKWTREDEVKGGREKRTESYKQGQEGRERGCEVRREREGERENAREVRGIMGERGKDEVWREREKIDADKVTSTDGRRREHRGRREREKAERNKTGRRDKDRCF